MAQAKVQKVNRTKEASAPESALYGEDLTTNGWREGQALRIVRWYSLGAGAIGFMPVFLIDVVAVTTVQVALARSLAKLYGVEFLPQVARSAVTSLVIGSGVSNFLYPGMKSVLKIVPIVGQFAGGLSVGALSSATTYAVGKVFIQHFEAGGTFLTLDPEKVRGYFAEQVEARKQEMSADDKS